MRLVLHQGNVLDASSDALVLPIDGAARGLEGNVARQFARRWGQEAWAQLDDSVEFPVPLGTAAYVACEPPLPFRGVFLASVLGHLEPGQYTGYLRSALDWVFERAARMRLARVASPLLVGGWRASADRAFAVTLEAVDAHRAYAGRLEIYSLLPEHHAHLVALARSLGVREDDTAG